MVNKFRVIQEFGYGVRSSLLIVLIVGRLNSVHRFFYIFL